MDTPPPPGVEIPPQQQEQAGDVQGQQQQQHYAQQQAPFWNFIQPPAFMPQWGAYPPAPPLHQVKLPPFWSRDVQAWFTLVESTFNRYRIENSRLRFDLVLPALPEDALERVRAVLHAAPATADPYAVLRRRLLEVYTPSVLDLAHRIMYAPELGGRRPSELMETMLAALPPGEQAGILFKAHFLARLPADFRDLVAINVVNFDPLQLAALADQLWMARNARPAAVAAAVQPDDELGELEESVAAINVNKKSNRERKRGGKKKQNAGGQHEKTAAGGQQAKRFLCRLHLIHGDKAYSCADTKFCQWAEN